MSSSPSPAGMQETLKVSAVDVGKYRLGRAHFVARGQWSHEQSPGGRGSRRPRAQSGEHRCRHSLGRLVGIAGVSGSGKSSLAMGVLYAEGSRRYIEALSTYTRRRMSQAPRADVDRVSHVPAALALRQRPGIPASGRPSARPLNCSTSSGSCSRAWHHMSARTATGRNRHSMLRQRSRSPARPVEQMSRLPERRSWPSIRSEPAHHVTALASCARSTMLLSSAMRT